MLEIIFVLLNWWGIAFANPAITHSGDADLNALVGEALHDWGARSLITDGGPGPMITIEWVTPDDPDWGHAYAVPVHDGKTVESCHIVIGTGIEAPLPILRLTIRHEVGHCLGFDHYPGGDSIMRPFSRPMSAYDYWAAAQIYGPRTFAHRVIVPGIAH